MLFGQDSWKHAIKTFIPCVPYGTHRVHFVLKSIKYNWKYMLDVLELLYVENRTYTLTQRILKIIVQENRKWNTVIFNLPIYNGKQLQYGTVGLKCKKTIYGDENKNEFLIPGIEVNIFISSNSHDPGFYISRYQL